MVRWGGDLIKCVTQRYFVDVARVRISLKFRIDEEYHWHSHMLAGLDRLLGKTKAGNFVKVFSDIYRADIEYGLSRNASRCQVRCVIENLGLRSGIDRDHLLFRFKPPS